MPVYIKKHSQAQCATDLFIKFFVSAHIIPFVAPAEKYLYVVIKHIIQIDVSSIHGLRPFAILNIALQNGKNVGSGWGFPDSDYAMDGTINLVGKSVICWNGSRLSCLNNIVHSTDAGVPQVQNSWAQGGIGLYLCDRNWTEKYTAESNTPSLSENAARTGILINTSTKYVYLFANRVMSTVPVLRAAMMAYAGLTNGGSAGSWAAIMTDGGRSTQLYTAENSTAALRARGVPQIIALKNKN